VAALGLALLGLLPGRGRADFILESATLGPTGQVTGGPVLDPDQYLGARFQVSTAVHVDHVGGHLYGTIAGGLFAAIILLPPGGSALPTFPPSQIATMALADRSPRLWLVPPAHRKQSAPVTRIRVRSDLGTVKDAEALRAAYNTTHKLAAVPRHSGVQPQ